MEESGKPNFLLTGIGAAGCSISTPLHGLRLELSDLPSPGYGLGA